MLRIVSQRGVSPEDAIGANVSTHGTARAEMPAGRSKMMGINHAPAG